MKASIDVKTRAEKEAIERALADPQMLAFVTIVGILQPLTDGGRRRVLAFIAEHNDEARCASLRIEQEQTP